MSMETLLTVLSALPLAIGVAGIFLMWVTDGLSARWDEL